jgi:hypothetical protein
LTLSVDFIATYHETFLNPINTATLATDMKLLIIIIVLAILFSRVFNKMDEPEN